MLHAKVWSIEFVLYLFILVFCPLAFGTVEQWSITVMEFVVTASLSILLLRTVARDRGRCYRVPGAVPLFLLLAFMMIQAVPLPPGLQSTLSPAAHNVYESLQILQGHLPYLPLTVNLQATAREFFRIATYVLFYLLTVNLLDSYARLKTTLFIVAGLAGTIAFLAILQKFTSHGLIFWFRSAPENTAPVGPWIYHNQFAGFMEMLIPLTAALFLCYRPNVSYKIPLRQKIVEFFSFPGANSYILLGFSAVIAAVSIFISLSRGGITSFLLSFLLFLFLVARRNSLIRSILPVLTIFVLFIQGVTWFGWEPIVKRFQGIVNEQGQIFNGRFYIWQDCLNIIKDYWLCGTGFGTLEQIFPLYRNKMPYGTILDHAHNDFIELWTDGGIISLVLVGWFFMTIMWHGWNRIRNRRDIFSIYCFKGAFCGIAAMFFHSFLDFNMHNGADGLYFFFLCGVMVSAINIRRYGRTRKNLLDKRKTAMALLTVSVFIMIIGTRFNVGQLVSQNIFNQINRVYLNRFIPRERLMDMRASIQKAIDANPLDARNRFAAANIDAFLNRPSMTLEEYGKTLWLEPTNPDFLMRIGIYTGRDDFKAGNSLMKRAIKYDHLNPDLHFEYAGWLFEQGHIREGIEELKEVMDLDAKRLKECINLLIAHGMDIQDTEQIMPDRVQPYLNLAAYFEKMGQEKTATALYRKALFMVKHEKKMERHFFIVPYDFFVRHHMYDEALVAINQGIQYYPKDSLIHMKAGDLYRRIGLVFKAEEEYRQVLVIDPDNNAARKKLQAVSRD